MVRTTWKDCKKDMKITLATTWESKCGVAMYSQELVAELERFAEVEVIALDKGAVTSPARLAARLNDADVAHVQHQYPFFGGMAIQRNWFRQMLARVDVPLVVTVHELDLGESDPFPLRMYKQWFNKYLFRSPEIDRLIVHSADYKMKLERLGVSAEDIRVVPQGVPSVLRSTVSQGAAKLHFGLAGRRVMVILGFVVKRKGYELALNAMKSLPKDISLLIAGGPHPDDETGYFEDLQAQIEEDGLSDRVKMTGYLPDSRVSLAMAAADVVLAPFTSISNSSSILRAMAYGKPIISADLPWTRELNAGKPKLSLFAPGDGRELVRRIIECLDNAAIRDGLVSAIRSYGDSWTVAQAASRTLSVYKELLSECE